MSIIVLDQTRNISFVRRIEKQKKTWKNSPSVQLICISICISGTRTQTRSAQSQSNVSQSERNDDNEPQRATNQGDPSARQRHLWTSGGTNQLILSIHPKFRCLKSPASSLCKLHSNLTLI